MHRQEADLERRLNALVWHFQNIGANLRTTFEKGELEKEASAGLEIARDLVERLETFSREDVAKLEEIAGALESEPALVSAQWKDDAAELRRVAGHLLSGEGGERLELRKRLLGEDAVDAGAASSHTSEFGPVQARAVIAAAWDVATGHAFPDIELEHPPAVETVPGGDCSNPRCGESFPGKITLKHDGAQIWTAPCPDCAGREGDARA